MNKANYILTNTAAIQDLHQIGLVKTISMHTDKSKRALLKDYSSESVFEDDAWLIDKKETEMNFPRHVRIMRFQKVPILLKDSVKDWALDQLLCGRKIKGIKSSLCSIESCLSLVAADRRLPEIDAGDIMIIHDTLFSGSISTDTASARWAKLKCFFEYMECPRQAADMQSYVVPTAKKGRKRNDKYIPATAAAQMDIIFMDEEIVPLAYRCVYWTLRLWPTRIEEVMSIKVDALRQVADDMYILTYPISKTAGNFEEPEIKVRRISCETKIGRMYVDLIKRQTAAAAEANGDYLLMSRKVCYMPKAHRYMETGSTYFTLNESMMYNFFSKFGKRFNIVDEEGNPVNITTHKFRHTSSSDKVNSGIFTPNDVMHQTGHKNTAMLEQNYLHEKAPERRLPVFRGKIMDERRMAKILERPYAKEIYHLGICSDIRECGGSRLACLKCSHLEVDRGMLPFMLRDQEDWKKKLSRVEEIGNEDYASTCRDWIEAYDVVFARINEEE